MLSTRLQGFTRLRSKHPILMKIHTLVLVLAFASYLNIHAASVSAPSTGWMAVEGNFDFIGDTNEADLDIVGQAEDYGLFVTHSGNGSEDSREGVFGFRLRLDAAGGNRKETSYEKAAFLGIDADSNDGLDVFIGVDFSGKQPVLGLFAPSGEAKGNNGPANTVISQTPFISYEISDRNYSYRPVDFKMDGGTTNDLNPGEQGEPDYYLSVMVDFADIVSYLSGQGIRIDKRSPLRFWAATSTMGGSFDGDIAGIEGAWQPEGTWRELGALSQAVAIPEPGAAAVLAVGSMALLFRRRRQSA